MKKIIRTAFSFIRKAAGSVASERRRKSARIAALGGDLDFIYNAIADEAGYNITYIESMNGSLFPSVLALAEGKTDGDGHEFDDCRFLAENGFVLPKRLQEAPDWRIKAYIRLHQNALLDFIEAEAESDYYFRIGEHYNTQRYAEKIQIA